MAESKPQKVDISIQPSSANTQSHDTSAVSSGSTVADSQTPQSEVEEHEHASSDKQHAEDTTISGFSRASAESGARQDQNHEAKNAVGGSDALRQNAGQETTIEPPESSSSDASEQHMDESQRQESPHTEEESRQGDQTTTHTEENAENQNNDNGKEVEPPPVTIHDSDFYSSKMDTSNPLSADSSPSSSSHSRYKRVSTSFGVILLIFIVTVIVGFVVLYQLEQMQPGAGIIFDWFA